MTFYNLNTDCDCVDDSCIVNTIDVFCRRILDDTINLNDFDSYWEMGRRPNNIGNCNEVCKYKGVSVSIFIDDKTIMSVYEKTGLFRRKNNTKYYCKLKFKDEAGKIKESLSGNDPNHHIFFKSDQFTLDKIENIEIKPII